MSKPDALVARANLLMAAALIVLLLVLGAALSEAFHAAYQARLLSDRSYAVLVAIKDLDLGVRAAESGQRGYLLTGEEIYLYPYNQALGRIGTLQAQLQSLIADDATAAATLREINPLIQLKLQDLAQTIALQRRVGNEAARKRVVGGVGHGYMVRIDAGLGALQRHENQLLARRLRKVSGRALDVRLASYGAFACLVLALIAAAWLLNLALRRNAAAEVRQRALLDRLRTSIDSISQGIGVFDAELRLSDWNHCFGQLLHIPDGLLVVGTPYQLFVDTIGGETAPFLEPQAQIGEGEPAGGRPVSYERRLADGRLMELRRSIVPGAGFVLTISDMSKRAESEAALRESHKMQAIGQLTGGVAHDFNNLLTVVMGNLEFASAKLPPGQEMLATRLDRAMWAARRGATLTAQLLAVARRQPLAPISLDLAAILPELVPLLHRTLGEHIEVRFVDSAGVWPALADRSQLEAAVLNLALNARDAMEGGGRLTIELANKALDSRYAATNAEVTPGDYVMVAVSDTGHGMAPEVRARAFEPFFTTKPDGRGTGLGLAMVFGFARQSGGHVKIYSEPGAGTTLRLYLPRAIGAPAPQRLDNPSGLPRGNATVLVVEDEGAVREIAVTILRDLGYQVLEASAAEEALELFRAEEARVDLLLTDVMLPGKMRGRELADHIASARPDIRVLFMSGYTENAIVHHGRLNEGVNLIAKPFKREQLAQKVAEALRAG